MYPCPFCFYEKTAVMQTYDSRKKKENKFSVERVRTCPRCGATFTTKEEFKIQVRKRNFEKSKTLGRRKKDLEDYDPMKIRKGIELAARKRPKMTSSLTETISSKVDRRIRELNRPIINSEEIGQFVLEELLRHDPVSFIRFASVFYYYETPEEFVKQVKNIKRKG